MANFIEKKLPKPVRSQMQTMIAGALGLFLGLQYNDYFKGIFEMILPETEGFAWKTLILLAMTALVVYVTIFIQNALDGK
jgi:hypothetical protein